MIKNTVSLLILETVILNTSAIIAKHRVGRKVEGSFEKVVHGRPMLELI